VFFIARVYNLRPYRQTERGALYRMGFIMSNGLKIERRWLQSLINLSRGVLRRQRCSSPPMYPTFLHPNLTSIFLKEEKTYEDAFSI
jgi:hypothetical protein